MSALYIAVAMFFSVIFIVREVALLRERIQVVRVVSELRGALTASRAEMIRMAEEVFLLKALLVERRHLTEKDVVEARQRLIERPRLQAEERRVLKQHSATTSTQVLVDGDNNVH